MKRHLYGLFFLHSILVMPSFNQQDYEAQQASVHRRHVAICAKFFRQPVAVVKKRMVEIWPVSVSKGESVRLNLAAQAGNFDVFMTILKRQKHSDIRQQRVQVALKFARGEYSYAIGSDLPVDTQGRDAIQRWIDQK